jgi:hypothetical protein
MRVFAAAAAAILIGACGKPASTVTASGEKKTGEHVRITQFYAPEKMLPRGLKGNLCYGVEHARKVELNPPVEELWPSPVRCFEISPKQNTTYTLTAFGEDGSQETKSLDVTVGAPPPRLYDLSVNATQVHPGEKVTVCFKLENVTNVKASPGKFDRHYNCIFDNPKKTTTYKIVAYGGNNQEDSGAVTVKVR